MSGTGIEAPIGVGGPFHVRWENVTDSHGWLDMRVGSLAHLMAGDPDPYPELVRWVEECCVEQKSASFHWDSDGFEFLICHVSSCHYLRVEEITSLARPVTVWAGHVTPKELCGGFYQGLLRFAESLEFDAARWCLIPLGEWVEWLARRPIDDLVAAWIKCSSKQIWNHFEELFEYAEGRNQGQEMRFPGIPSHDAFLCRVQTREMILAPRWDEALQEERQGLLKEFLSQMMGLDYGCHPRELRSPRLDAWWEDNVDLVGA